ncbi:HPr family phosphocarrier protein [Solemya velum gill symbiont]|uniref:Phosphocarrier protein HPr n=1 Tax=Solemya velum gill symbiont TaxID=2340 RepID=A0A0B0H996_SOVGS|nr:HPr family phosphocarrier protein [Solemya velum gill symbiont]KHF24026.1 phosphotransferase [Solemya velum gill symbiont]OOY36206.1 phosphocarrier protein HPr [Solemya velum gill symbiont]OOY39029.1 phosphocarrier protein HPr [Solemya velum gill symbiont]OOY41484.1 phosphocarrier protein HPr [Solemya velum gill symbiont]OOY46806.1 phosphocarrier protein HPr [Solemya velum gill symbiont]
MSQRELTIINKLGLHARAAAKFVATASRFSSLIQVEKSGQKVNAKSIMGVMMLAASRGTTITLEANGDDAEDALDALEALINDKFGESE